MIKEARLVNETNSSSTKLGSFATLDLWNMTKCRTYFPSKEKAKTTHTQFFFFSLGGIFREVGKQCLVFLNS